MKKDEVVKLRIPADEKDEWAEAARAAGLSLSAWVRVTIAKHLEERKRGG